MQVAIKRSLFQVLGDPQARSRCKLALREAAINASLDHPNIVRSYTHDLQPLGDPMVSERVSRGVLVNLSTHVIVFRETRGNSLSIGSSSSCKSSVTGGRC